MDCCATRDELQTSKKNEDVRIHHKQAEDAWKQFKEDSQDTCIAGQKMLLKEPVRLRLRLSAVY